jgi:uncharacterized protein
MALSRYVSRFGSQLSSAVVPHLGARAPDALPTHVPSFSIEAAPLADAPPSVPQDQPQAPAMRGLKLIRSHDGRATCGVWDCQAGVFDVTFKCDEIVHILEGEVIVRSDGTQKTLRPGDVAFFREGLVTTWDVPQYVRKLWFHHFREPTLRERAEYKLRLLLGTVPKD